MLLDPKSLQFFLSAVEEGSIAATATREHIAPAAVSKRLSELEETLHTQLFIRNNKGIEVTGAGLRLVNLAHQILFDINNVSVQMEDYRNGTRGHVRVFANIAAITQFLPRELKKFRVKHPLAEVTLREVLSAMVTRGVSENAADVGLFTLGVGNLYDNLEIFPYRKDSLVLIVPEGHPLGARRSVSMKDILGFEFICLIWAVGVYTELMKAASELGRGPNIRTQVAGYDTLCLMVEADLGIGILPKKSAKPFVRALRLRTVALDESWAERKLAICVRSYEKLSPLAKILVDQLRLSSDAQST